MRKVLFVRHAKSSWKNADLSDHDRPLNPRGERDAPAMAEYLHDEGLELDLILTSTANRALSTARYFQNEFGLSDDMFWTERILYHAPPEVLVSALHQVPSECNTVAIFAHNPGMTMLADQLSPSPIVNVPTCGVTVATFKGEWETVNRGQLKFIDLIVPKSI